MQNTTSNVVFNNRQNPNAKVDIVKLEEVLQRDGISHSPYEFHRLKFYVLILIREGDGIHTIDFTDYHYSKGTIFTIRKDQIHKFTFSQSVKGTMIIFTEDFLISYLGEQMALKTMQLFNEMLGKPVIQLDDNQHADIFGIIDRQHTEYFEKYDEYSQEIIRSELHILITKLFRINSSLNQEVYNQKYLGEFIILQKLVEENVKKTIKVKDYAEMMNTSTKTLNNITKSILKCGAKEFIDEVCINEIKRLLINTTLAIKEIAYELGFDETTNFYKYFKHRTNQTPEEFRSSF